MLERTRDWWEHLAPREKRLMWLLVGALGLTLVLLVALRIDDGLDEIEVRNASARDALRTLDEKRDELIAERSRVADPTAMIGEEPPALGTYLERIEGEVGVKIKATSDKPPVQKGKFREHAVQVTLQDVSLEQLAQFLKRVETNSQIVVTQRLFVKRSNIAKEKMDRVDITVATYERPRRGGGRASATADAGAARPAEEGQP